MAAITAGLPMLNPGILLGAALLLLFSLGLALLLRHHAQRSTEQTENVH